MQYLSWSTIGQIFEIFQDDGHFNPNAAQRPLTPGIAGANQGFRLPMQGRFVRPTNTGKEMRFRMQSIQRPGQNPRPGSPMYPPGGSPSMSPQQFGGMSPQHSQSSPQPGAGGMIVQQPQAATSGGMMINPSQQQPQLAQGMNQGQPLPQQIQQMRPPSAGGVGSPATDRPVTPQTPRTPGGGPSTPSSQMSQPSTPEPNVSGGGFQQQFVQQQQQQMQPIQPQQGGGGGNPNNPVLPLHNGFGEGGGNVGGLRGGWGKSIGLKGGEKRGGWSGLSIGLKGGSPIFTQSNTNTTNTTQAAVVPNSIITVNSVGSNIATPLGQSGQALQNVTVAIVPGSSSSLMPSFSQQQPNPAVSMSTSGVSTLGVGGVLQVNPPAIATKTVIARVPTVGVSQTQSVNNISGLNQRLRSLTPNLPTSQIGVITGPSQQIQRIVRPTMIAGTVAASNNSNTILQPSNPVGGSFIVSAGNAPRPTLPHNTSINNIKTMVTVPKIVGTSTTIIPSASNPVVNLNPSSTITKVEKTPNCAVSMTTVFSTNANSTSMMANKIATSVIQTPTGNAPNLVASQFAMKSSQPTTAGSTASTTLQSAQPNATTAIASISATQNTTLSRTTSVVTATKSIAAPVSSQMTLTSNATVTQSNNVMAIRSGTTMQASTSNAENHQNALLKQLLSSNSGSGTGVADGQGASHSVSLEDQLSRPPIEQADNKFKQMQNFGKQTLSSLATQIPHPPTPIATTSSGPTTISSSIASNNDNTSNQAIVSTSNKPAEASSDSIKDTQKTTVVSNITTAPATQLNNVIISQTNPILQTSTMTNVSSSGQVATQSVPKAAGSEAVTTVVSTSVGTATNIKPSGAITQPSLLTLPTVPVPEASLVAKSAPAPMPITVNRPLLPQNQQPGSTVLQQRVGNITTTVPQQTSTVTLRGVRPQLPGQVSTGLQHTRLPMVPLRQMQPQPQQILQQQRPQQSSQLQGLLQQQTLVPQERLPLQQNQANLPTANNMGNQHNLQNQQQVQQNQQQQIVPQMQINTNNMQPQRMMQLQPQHPGMPGMRQPGVMPPQQQQMRMQQIQMQQQQHGYRMQQQLPTRPSMTPTQIGSGEPIRPNFPPQQPVASVSDSMRHMRPMGPNNQTVAFQANQSPLSTIPMNHQPGTISQMTPPVRNTLRLSIPPQQQLMPGSQQRTPGPPGAFGSQQPSPSLTPRSDDGDSNSSRGTTPGPMSAMNNPGTNPMEHQMSAGSAPGTPMMETNTPLNPSNGMMMDHVSQKVAKRRPSQQKRRQSQGGVPGMSPSSKLDGGPAAKKQRPRKGSKIDESDYDSFIDTVMGHLKNLPPVTSVEPKMGHYYSSCPVFGAGDVPKASKSDYDPQKGCLNGQYGRATFSSEGDYYSIMPFGPEPPVPHIHPVTITSRGYYNVEFDSKPEKKTIKEEEDTPSPDLLYSSSPEPDENDQAKALSSMGYKNDANNAGSKDVSEKDIKQEVIIKEEPMSEDDKICEKEQKMVRPWHDLEPDISDDEVENINKDNKASGDTDAEGGSQEPKSASTPILSKPPRIVERPHSPLADIVGPIPIRPKPAQIITLQDLKDMDKENKYDAMGAVAKTKSKSILPIKSNGSNGITSITMTLGGSNGTSKNVLKALNGLAKLLKVETPKQWMVEDKNGIRDIFRAKEEYEEPLDIQSVLTTETKFCRYCDLVIQSDMISRKACELPFLTKYEREESTEDVYFCDKNCYFKLAISRTSGAEDNKDIKSLEQLEQWQEKRRANLDTDTKSETGDGEASDEMKAVHKGNAYKHFDAESADLKCKRSKKLNENELTQMMFQIGTTVMPPRETEDTRECLFCGIRGDGPADGPGRLLNYDVNKWVHLNCALWSEDVYETVSGALVNVDTALKNGANLTCKICEKPGATVKCFKVRCTNYYHVGCAAKDRAMFYKNKSVFCNQHIPKSEKDQELTTLAVYRRVYIDRDENRQVAKVMTQGIDQHTLRVGSLTFLSLGQILPHQLHNFHNTDYIYPIGYKILRHYWSMTEVNKRTTYVCSISEVDNKPEFKVSTTVMEDGNEVEKEFVGSSPKEAWRKILSSIEKLRRKKEMVNIFPRYLSGEDLFGLTEPNIVKVLESLPGIESCTDYNFKYGRNPLLELPLAVNPTGCARSEPSMRTNAKRVHNFQRTTGTSTKSGSGNHRAAKEMTNTLIGLETTGPYSKNFVQSKSSQYRKMKQEWRQNVVLARSKIQGLGLYAARDLEKHQMIIEYIGEVIRSDLTDIREKKYEAQNRGIYMFRLDDDRVLDATMCGGMARYINHSCDPSCVTETVEVDRDNHIIIFANRRISRGEELSYDYKFDYEDDNRIPCNCGASNCRKWMN